MAGIRQEEGTAGFESIIFEPVTDSRVPHVHTEFDSVKGKISSDITITENGTNYIFEVPDGVKAKAVLHGREFPLAAGYNKLAE